MSKLVSAHLEQRRIRETNNARFHRIVAGIMWLIVCSGMGLWFATFGWLAASHSLHRPYWLVLTYITLAVLCFVMCITALLKGLDDLFYQKDDRRRLTRRSIDR